MRPVVPGKNATGTNTATSTMPMTMTAENTSRIASTAASCALLLYSRMCRSTFSITTIASSTTMPVASTMPNSVSVLIEKPKSLTNANVPMSDTGIVIAGMIVLRQFCRNRNITSTTRPMASASVFSTSMIDSSHDRDVVEGDLRLEARRKVQPQPLELPAGCPRRPEWRWPLAAAARPRRRPRRPQTAGSSV